MFYIQRLFILCGLLFIVLCPMALAGSDTTGFHSEGSDTFQATLLGNVLTLTLPTAKPGDHDVKISCQTLGNLPLASINRHIKSTSAGVVLTDKVAVDPGVYKFTGQIDGQNLDPITLYVPGVRRDHGDLFINGQPFSGFVWSWWPLSQIPGTDSKDTTLNQYSAQNMLRPKELGGFGFNCAFIDPTQLKTTDFASLAKVGGHVCIGVCTWTGIKAFGPKTWNTGVKLDPIILSDGTVAAGGGGCFESKHNRDIFVHDLQCFKDTFGNPESLLGFYCFESGPDMPWANRNLYTDYSDASKNAFRTWLAQRYGSLAAFNKKHHKNFNDFSQVQPPKNPDDVTAQNFDPSYWNDWIDFRYWAMADFQRWAKEQIKNIFGPDKMLVTIEGLLASSATNDSNVTGCNSFCAIDERLRAKTTDFIGVEGTYDYSPTDVRILRHATDFNHIGLPDIAIVMDYYNYSWQPSQSYGERAEIPRLRLVDILGAGGSGGILEHTGEWTIRAEQNEMLQKGTADPKSDIARPGQANIEATHVTLDNLRGYGMIGEINALRNRYPALFTHAHTPVDVYESIPIPQLHYDSRFRQDARWWDLLVSGFQTAMQRSQIAPGIFYSDELIPSDATTLMVPLGERTSEAFLFELRGAIANGAKAYIEGTAIFDEFGRPRNFPLADMVGATLGGAPTGSQGQKYTRLNLSNGQTIDCMRPCNLQNVKSEILGRFADGTPALVRNHFGKGEVIFSPSLIGAAAGEEEWKNAIYKLNYPEGSRKFYQQALLSFCDPTVTVHGALSPQDLRTGILVKDKSTVLMASNWSANTQSFTLDLRGNYTVAYDLRNQQWINVKNNNGHITLPMQCGGYDWSAIALGHDKTSLQSVLNTPAVQFKILN
jgi:hypothetical protein